MKYYKELWLLQAIVFILVWIFNEYLGTLLTFITVPIFMALLLISLISEKLEKSNVSREYYYFMAGIAIIPVLIFIMVYFANEGYIFEWSKDK